MPHPLVDQLRFARREFRRGLARVTPAEAIHRFLPMNCISWNVGHLAWQEQRYFLTFAQDQTPYPEIQKEFAYGAPASTPDLDAMWAAWTDITRRADAWLDALTPPMLLENVVRNGKPSPVIYGSLILRTTYHYWYHTGENQAIRQMLGHTGLPVFVGNIDDQAPYRPEN